MISNMDAITKVATISVILAAAVLKSKLRHDRRHRYDGSDPPTISNIKPIRYNCNYIKLNIRDNLISLSLYLEHLQMLYIKKKFGDNYMYQDLNEVSYIDFTGFIINQLNSTCYKKFIDEQYNKQEAILLYSILQRTYEKFIDVFFKYPADEQSVAEKLHQEKLKELLLYLNIFPESEEAHKNLTTTISKYLETLRGYGQIAV